MNWTPDLTLQDLKEQLAVWIAALVFMDDITWVERSAEDLQNILDIAKQYYATNDSRINVNKSKLLVFNTPETERKKRACMGTDWKQILPVSPTEPIHFLEIYFSQRNQLKIMIDIIKREIEQVVNVLKWKKVMNIQAYYILNMILRLHIEFRLINVFLPKSTCQKLTSTFVKYFKHVISSSSITLNIIPSLPQPYNILNIQQL